MRSVLTYWEVSLAVTGFSQLARFSLCPRHVNLCLVHHFGMEYKKTSSGDCNSNSLHATKPHQWGIFQLGFDIDIGLSLQWSKQSES